jgi:REP element-mobilizing transposase RayT
VFVTKYRRAVFKDAMRRHCEATVPDACGQLSSELAQFNGEADYVHPLLAQSPTLAISTLVNRLNDVSARDSGTSSPTVQPSPHERAPAVAVLLRRSLQRRTTVDHQAVIEPRPA